MKLSTKIRYGVRAILDIAAQPANGPVPLSDISKREKISAKYLESIMPALKAAELIRSVKGPGGGYVLSRAPEEITLYDIVAALEGPTCLVDCINQPESCIVQETCVVYDVWKGLSQLINDSLRSVNLRELITRQKEKIAGARGTFTYNI